MRDVLVQCLVFGILAWGFCFVALRYGAARAEASA
jgi:hypothetical protein